MSNRINESDALHLITKGFNRTQGAPSPTAQLRAFCPYWLVELPWLRVCTSKKKSNVHNKKNGRHRLRNRIKYAYLWARSREDVVVSDCPKDSVVELLIIQ